VVGEKHILIVAGGTGSRINNSLPKQFIEINNKPIIIHTIERFISFEPEIHLYIAVHPDFLEHMRKLIADYFPGKEISITIGGETRFHSVLNGLKMISTDSGIVGIHDAARPLVSSETIKRCFSVAAEKGNAIPFISVNESLRHVTNDDNMAVNRNEYRIIQTPQCFQVGLIKKAFKQAYNSAFTDDASVMEKAGYKINLVEGNTENIKITYPIDLIIAQHYLK
jgi:2-C-methyl-D-erythritol 4-phosphate cytidylyltransferase